MCPKMVGRTWDVERRLVGRIRAFQNTKCTPRVDLPIWPHYSGAHRFEPAIVYVRVVNILRYYGRVDFKVRGTECHFIGQAIEALSVHALATNIAGLVKTHFVARLPPPVVRRGTIFHVRIVTCATLAFGDNGQLFHRIRPFDQHDLTNGFYVTGWLGACWVVALGWEVRYTFPREGALVGFRFQPVCAGNGWKQGSQFGSAFVCVHQIPNCNVPVCDGIGAFLGSTNRRHGESVRNVVVVLLHFQLRVHWGAARDGGVDKVGKF